MRWYPPKQSGPPLRVKLLRIDAVALDPALDLKPGLLERPCYSGDVSTVLSQQAKDFIAPPLIALAELQLASIGGNAFRSRLRRRARLRLRRRRAERLGEMRQLDAFASGQDGSRGNALFQFADVPRPVVQNQCARSVGAEADLFRPVCEVSPKEHADQQPEIFSAFS